jgi:hypothetical protein
MRVVFARSPPPPEIRLRPGVRRCGGSGPCRWSALGFGRVLMAAPGSAARAILATLIRHDQRSCWYPWLVVFCLTLPCRSCSRFSGGRSAGFLSADVGGWRYWRQVLRHINGPRALWPVVADPLEINEATEGRERRSQGIERRATPGRALQCENRLDDPPGIARPGGRSEPRLGDHVPERAQALQPPLRRVPRDKAAFSAPMDVPTSRSGSRPASSSAS